MLKKLDENVGTILSLLDSLNLTDNTLIIFSSNNGAVGGYHEMGLLQDKENTGNTPLKGGKGMLFEGGIRVPWIVSWPGKVKGGFRSAEPIVGTDLFPTLLDAIAIEKSQYEQQNQWILDGESFLPLATGEATRLNRDFIPFHFPAYHSSCLNLNLKEANSTP